MKVAFIAVLLSSALISIVAWNPPGCVFWDCSRCYPGWTRIEQSQSNYSCQACAPNCLSCDVAGPNKCDNCTLGNRLNSTSQTCEPCAPNCKNCDSSGPDQCDICQDGFYATGSLYIYSCGKCDAWCKTCDSYPTCTSCLPGMNLVNGFCSPTTEPSVTGYYVAIILVSVFGLLLTVVGIFLGYRKGKQNFNEDMMKPVNTSVTI